MKLPKFEGLKLISETAEVKRIYLAIETALPRGPSGCLVVTSASPGEGKTLTVAALATMAAAQGQGRVLALDLNWFRPGLHVCFGMSQGIDLSDMKQKGISDLVQTPAPDGVHVLTAPRLDASGSSLGIKEQDVAEEVLRQARNAYDLVLVDSPAMFPINRNMMDPVAFSRFADGVILVVLPYSTPRQTVRRAQKTLESSGRELFGIVVNQWKNPLHDSKALLQRKKA